MRPAARRALLGVGVAGALALAGCGGASSAADPSTGPRAAAPAASTPPSAAPTSTLTPLSTAPAKLDALRAKAATRPVQVQVPGYGKAAPITERTADPVSGGLDLPTNPADVAWWSAGSLPGDNQGNVVLASHVNYNGKTGPFTNLSKLKKGQVIRLRTANGNWLSYRIADVRQFSKATLDRQDLFATDGPAQLRLVTCGGKYDPKTRNYADNVVVTALPV